MFHKKLYQWDMYYVWKRCTMQWGQTKETYCLQGEWTSKHRGIKVGEEKSGKLEGLYWIKPKRCSSSTSPLSHSLFLSFSALFWVGLMESNERACPEQDWWEQLWRGWYEPMRTDADCCGSNMEITFLVYLKKYLI